MSCRTNLLKIQINSKRWDRVQISADGPQSFLSLPPQYLLLCLKPGGSNKHTALQLAFKFRVSLYHCLLVHFVKEVRLLLHTRQENQKSHIMGIVHSLMCVCAFM